MTTPERVDELRAIVRQYIHVGFASDNHEPVDALNELAAIAKEAVERVSELESAATPVTNWCVRQMEMASADATSGELFSEICGCEDPCAGCHAFPLVKAARGERVAEIERDLAERREAYLAEVKA